MTIAHPSRLRGLFPMNVFVVTAAGAQYVDSNTLSISLRRGASSAPSGLTAANAEVSVPVELPPAHFDAWLSVRISTEAAAFLGIDDDTRTRWVGRIAGQQVTDYGPQRRTTTITAASWSQQVPLVTRPQTTTPGTVIHDLLATAWSETHIQPTLTVRGDSDSIHHPGGKPLTIGKDDVWTKYCRDLGILVRTLRNGNAEAIALYARETDARNWRTLSPLPIMRRYCVSPASWSQPLTNPSVVNWTYRVDDTTTETVQIRVGADTTQRALAPIDLDTSHAWRSTGNQERLANATANAATALGYRVESVTFDVLALISQGSLEPDRLQFVRQLLALEEGQPVALSHDWPTSAVGVYYASEITETITRDAWRITLAIDPTKHITGAASPDVSGSTWDTAYRAGTSWDATPGSWEQA